MELTVTETSRQLGLTPRRVRALIERGQLPARRRGPMWVTTVDAVETYRRTAPGRGRPERPATAWKRLRAIAAHDRPPALEHMLPTLRARSRRTRVALPASLRGTNRHPRVAHLAVVDPPAPTGDAGIDSLLAGIAEAIADDHGFDRPAWTSDVPPAPLVASGMVADGDDRNGDVPEAFAVRGLGFERAAFWRR